MGFLSPWLLLGLGAAAIPIAVHLLRRRDAPLVPFGPLELLLRVERRLRRRLRVRDLLLLAARVLVLVVLVLVAARPFVRVPSRVALAAGAPSSTVVVLDDSMSMRAGGAFARAKGAALELVAALGTDHSAALVLGGWPARVRLGLGFDPGALRSAIEDVEPSWRSTDLVDAVEQARKVLQGSGQPVRRIVVISDMARHAVPEGQSLDPGEGVDLRVIDVGAPRPPNATVSAIAARPAAEMGPGVWAVTATVQNFGPAPLREHVVTLRVAGRDVARGFVDVPGGQSRTKTFLHAFGEETRAEVRLAGDALAADDVRHVLLDPAPRRRILLVDGDPRPARWEDEVFYLARALDALGVSPTIVDAEALAGHRFADHDVVFLCNTTALPAARWPELEAMVRGGGGLVVTAGSVLTASPSPAPLRALLGLDAERSEEGSFRFAAPDRTRPVASALPPGGAGLTSTHLRERLVVRGQDASVKNLLEFEDGRPALTLHAVDDGRAALLATSIDRDWGDLPIRPAFVVLVRALVEELSGRSDAHAARDVRPGAPREVRAAGSVRRAVVETPDGRRVDLGSRLPAVFRDTEKPGAYRVLVERARGGLAEDLAASFVVNPDPRESDLRAGRPRVDPHTGRAAPVAQPTGQRSVPLAPALVLAVPVLFGLESLLRRR